MPFKTDTPRAAGWSETLLMLVAACVFGSLRADVGAVVALGGAVAAWATYRATPLRERRVRTSTGVAIMVFALGIALWLPVCIEQMVSP